jgi:hypothetical protein
MIINLCYGYRNWASTTCTAVQSTRELVNRSSELAPALPFHSFFYIRTGLLTVVEQELPLHLLMLPTKFILF